MSLPAVTWAFLGSLGIREILVIAVVTMVLYGRSGVARNLLQQTRYGRMVRPWVPDTPQARTKTKPRRTTWGDRWFWLLAAVAVTAVAAWVVTRVLISASAASH